jgi:hypothetical protein
MNVTTAADKVSRVALVGSGLALARGLEAFRVLHNVAIVALADVSGASEATRLAQKLGVPLVGNPLDVFRTDVEIVLELNGDTRQYERLLAVKPPRVEVMSARGARILLDLLTRENGGSGQRTTALIVVAPYQSKLFEYLRDAFRGIPEVDVTLDRRAEDRRQRVRNPDVERRVVGRRRRPSLDGDFRARGFAITRQQHD